MLTVSNSLSFTGSQIQQLRKSNIAIKKQLASMYKPVLEKVGVDTKGLTVEEIIRIYNLPEVSEKISKMNSLIAAKKYQTIK